MLAFASCEAPVKRRDWSAYDGPGREYFLEEEVPFIEVSDPLEPMNRGLAMVNEVVVRYGVAPLAWVYRLVIPTFVRNGIDNVAHNLCYPGRLTNNVLQGKWSECWDETRRFAINSTVGLAGWFDPATSHWEIPASEEDFGQTFAWAGWTSSTYMFVPVAGPTTVRDILGGIGDAALNPLTYVRPASVVQSFNARSDEVEPILRAMDSNYDLYQLARILYVLQHEVDANEVSWAPSASGEVETLAAVFLAPEDADFAGRGETHAVDVHGDGRDLPYTVWLQDEPAAMVYLVPGLGAHRMSDSTLAMAEAAHGFGASVACISSSMNFEFMQEGASVHVPGYLPMDGSDLLKAIRAVGRDLEVRYADRLTDERILVGASLGGAQVLYAAARDEAEEFDAYVALDPPVSLVHAARQIDEFYNAPLALSPETRRERMEQVLVKVIDLADGRVRPASELPFTPLEARYAIGLSFRTSLQSVILASQERHDMGVLQSERSRFNMAAAFTEVSEYSFMEYLYAFLLPYFAERMDDVTMDERGVETLLRRADLRSFEDGLRANRNVRVFANENDFILNHEHRAWLVEALGDRVLFFNRGGHLGNLHRDDVQEVIRRIVDRASDGEGEETGGEGVP